MHDYSLSHLSNAELLHDLTSLVAQDRATTARLLAHIAEFDARRLYLPAAYPSMYAYCVEELRLSEDAAYKRITVARVARQFPGIFEMLADGRLNMTSVGLLAPYLTPMNAAELLEAAAHRAKSDIEALIARRFPRSEEIGLMQALPGSAHAQLAPERVGTECPVSAPERISTPSKLAPIALERFMLQVSIGQDTHDKLRHAQDLLGHQIPSGDMAQVLDRALDALIEKLERRKCAATSRPRRARPSANRRHIPAEVRRAVWERDGGQCTFVSESGHRCSARKLLEFDHIEEVARGGRATVGGIRLRCRAHNQYGAECAFGAGFMGHKRDEARR